MITDEALLEHGYKRYPVAGEYLTGLFTKSVRDEAKKLLYTLEVHKSNFPDGHQSYEFKVRFYRGDDAGFYTIEYQPPHQVVDIGKIEEWYYHTFRRLEFIADRNND